MNTHAEILDEADDLPATTAMDVSQSLAVGLTRAEVDMQIATARTYPRSLKQVANRIRGMATLDQESAEECIYALPRGGKPIKGPSIRFAEILQQSYGNCRAAARVVHVDRVEMYVEAEGIFHDLETNAATSARVRRRISDKRGRLFNDDMIIMTGNAACAIAKRNAILGGVPKPLWRKAYDAVQHTVAGDVTTLSDARARVIAKFATYGKTAEDVFAAMGVNGEEDITVDHVTVLRGMLATLRNGEATVEEMFGSQREPRKSSHKTVANPLADDEPVVDEETGEVTERGPEPDEKPTHEATGRERQSDAARDVPPDQEDSHVDDRATSSTEGGGAEDDAPPPRTDEPSVLEEYVAELFETRSAEEIAALSDRWAKRLAAAGVEVVREARLRRARHTKDLAEAEAAEARR
ncbi:hypothetical protein ATO13_22216 [Stappia sp. 22II-S9-Z10]|nr:hypothetical protein ATO13_22216 [Stappia sp. 22II-S9-Z10]